MKRTHRCWLCKGEGSVLRSPNMKPYISLMDPEMAGDWFVDCPVCGGEGLITEEEWFEYTGLEADYDRWE